MYRSSSGDKVTEEFQGGELEEASRAPDPVEPAASGHAGCEGAGGGGAEENRAEEALGDQPLPESVRVPVREQPVPEESQPILNELERVVRVDVRVEAGGDQEVDGQGFGRSDLFGYQDQVGAVEGEVGGDAGLQDYYDQIDPYKQVKLDLGQINEELALWIANMKKGVNAKNYHYQDIRVEQEQTVQETEQAIIKQIYDSQDIQNVYIKFDFSTIKSYGPQHPLQT
eukprot:CAMPEP_0170555186 /NCGR_PEP_ID=MMETSP0211-20121228/13075_1 /TAXON_ID=311385 /ORGANISM="Pseudokeronopsis sp., Strain OXSARD2" /LENGTH=226 /DNA_ID=CAMNT_0010864841 /DNA_START=396 /DNA_END=1078 /DNA_ORIENTATION=-